MMMRDSAIMAEQARFKARVFVESARYPPTAADR